MNAKNSKNRKSSVNAKKKKIQKCKERKQTHRMQNFISKTFKEREVCKKCKE